MASDQRTRPPSAATHALVVDHTEKFANAAQCPFCGGHDVVVWLSHDAAPNTWTVLCQICEAEGPHRLDRGKAIQAWNIRFEDVGSLARIGEIIEAVSRDYGSLPKDMPADALDRIYALAKGRPETWRP